MTRTRITVNVNRNVKTLPEGSKIQSDRIPILSCRNRTLFHTVRIGILTYDRALKHHLLKQMGQPRLYPMLLLNQPLECRPLPIFTMRQHHVGLAGSQAGMPLQQFRLAGMMLNPPSVRILAFTCTDSP